MLILSMRRGLAVHRQMGAVD